MPPIIGKVAGEFPGGYAFALCAVLLANVLRNISTRLPHQLSDETVFLLASKYFLQEDLVRSLGYMPPPGLVFLKIGSYLASSDQCYLLVKLWNALCLTLAAVPAYFLARRVMPAQIAKVASVLVAITPPTLYGAYFTAEGTYILVFWIFAALSFGALIEPRRYGIALLAGVSVAFAYLIKPHALALCSAYLVAVTALWLAAHSGLPGFPRTVTESWQSRRMIVIHVACFASGAIGTLLVLGKVLGAEWLAAFDLKLYSNLASHGEARAAPFQTIGPVLNLLALHAAAIVSALAIPAALFVLFGLRRGSSDPETSILIVFSLAVVSMLVLMTAKATVDFHVVYGEPLYRLHGRYYSFSLPLLMFVAVAHFHERVPAVFNARTKVMGVIGAAMIVACVVTTQSRIFTFLDAPDLSYLLFGGGVLVAIIAGVVIAIGHVLGRACLKWLMLGGWAMMSLLNVAFASRLQHSEDRVQVGDRAVDVLRGLFPADDLDRGIIVGTSHPVAAARAAFRLASLSPVVSSVREGHLRRIDSTKWILVLGDQSGTAFNLAVIQVGDSAIYLVDRMDAASDSSTHQPQSAYLFGSSSALRPIASPAHDPEPWGIWLTGDAARIVFPQPLPARGNMTIVANVLDPGLQGPVSVQICGSKFSLRLTNTLGEYRVQYSCQHQPVSLQFSDMKPLAPLALGISGDSRGLSVALAEIRVQSRTR